MAVKGIVNPVTAVIAALTFIATAWLQISPIPQVVLAAIAGVILSRIDGKLGGKSGDQQDEMPDGKQEGGK
ncbi:MAG: hypothetical protein LBH09_07255 [Peptococcaceae bacterium]|nr:hypothetical protein [Peptococcaceae bacterium]